MALSSGTYTIADLNDGTSIWTIYHDGYAKPDTPGADWATKGWSTTPTSNSVWISTKLAADINSGVWGEPMRLKGVSVTSVTPYYAVSDSSTVTPTSGWTPNLSSISWTAGQYIWTREYTVYSDNTNSWSAAHVDSAHSVITNWCDTNNKTLIDGGHIATNTVDAKSIKADSITADKIKTGEIIGAINGDTSTVKIKADKVNLVGDVVVSGDYIKSTGDVIANNTVTGSNIVGDAVRGNTVYVGGVEMGTHSTTTRTNIITVQGHPPRYIKINDDWDLVQQDATLSFPLMNDHTFYLMWQIDSDISYENYTVRAYPGTTSTTFEKLVPHKESHSSNLRFGSATEISKSFTEDAVDGWTSTLPYVGGMTVPSNQDLIIRQSATSDYPYIKINAYGIYRYTNAITYSSKRWDELVP